jgi:tetratricopeptide (TPR) repeat protein
VPRLPWRADGNSGLALERVEAALDSAERSGHTHQPMLVSLKRALHEDRGELRAALAWVQRARRLDEELGRMDSADYLNLQRAEAALLMMMGEYRSARPMVDAMTRRGLAASSSGRLRPRQAYTAGLLSMRLGDLDTAHRHLQHAATRSQAQGWHWLTVQIELALAELRVELGRFEAAENSIAAVEAARLPESLPWQRLTPTTVKATLRLAQGAGVDAIRLIDAELKRFGHPHARDSVALSAALRVAAGAHWAAGDAERTRQLATDAVSMAERIVRHPQRSADVGESLLLLARAEHRLGVTVSRRRRRSAPRKPWPTDWTARTRSRGRHWHSRTRGDAARRRGMRWRRE